MTRPRLALAAFLCLTAGCFAADDARADAPPPLTPEQTASLSRALRLWSIGLVGNTAGFTATAADGHYDVRIPVQGDIGGTGIHLEGNPITAAASMGADGRWHFDTIALPSPLRTVWPPGPDGTHAESVETAQTQTGSAVVDPTLAGNSSGETARTGVRVVTTSGTVTTTLTMARDASHEEWVAASPGRVDTASVSRAGAVIVWTGAPGEPPPVGTKDSVGAREVTVTFQANDADPDRATELTHRALAFATGLPPRGAKLTADQRTELHAMLTLTHDLARETKLAMSADGIGVSSGDRPFNLDHLSARGALGSPDGKLDLRLRMEVAGLQLPDMPPGALRDLLPHHLVLAPYVTGMPVKDVFAMADEIIDGSFGKGEMASEAQGHLAQAPLTVGVEELGFDLGPAQLGAKGQLTASGADTMDGRADIEATGLDALLRRASGDRLLKRIVPVLIFLKGIGQQEGEKVVWHVVFRGGKLTVNGTDISGLLPAK